LEAFSDDGTDRGPGPAETKQLARDEGRLRLWESEYDQLRKARSRIANDTLWAEYLNRARKLLRHEKI
jgi:hypothetical protein